MNWYKDTIEISTHGKGLYDLTSAVESRIQQWKIQEGICYLFAPHASASLAISENYDPTAKADLEAFMERLVPESQPWHHHTLEGSDDSPSHMRSMITHSSLTIPVDEGRLSLGTWQGISLFEHRARGHHRLVLLRCLGIG